MTIPKSISISIDLNKIDQSYIINGKNGQKYLDLRLVNTPDNQYGNDYMVSQALPKAVREEVKNSGGDYPKTPILGNGKAWQCMDGSTNKGGNSQPKPEPASSGFGSNSDEGSDLPF